MIRQPDAPGEAATDGPVFGAQFRAGLADLFRWRRDVRHFSREPLPAGTLDRLISLACLAPSVGLSEPWRFVVVDSPDRRRAVRASFELCNRAALQAFEGERAGLYARLKLAGLDEAPCHFAVFADGSTTQGHGLGRGTVPASVDYSAVMAVHTLWLAARAEGIGLGWVSILDPGIVAGILDVPPDWTFIGYFCLGYASRDDDRPELEREGWDSRRPAASTILRR